MVLVEGGNKLGWGRWGQWWWVGGRWGVGLELHGNGVCVGAWLLHEPFSNLNGTGKRGARVGEQPNKEC
jgi:hypothetical protein